MYDFDEKTIHKFTYNFNKRKLYIEDFDKDILLYLKENIKPEVSLEEDFISFLNNELYNVHEKEVISFQREVLIPYAGLRHYCFKAKYLKKRNVVEGVIIDDTNDKITRKKIIQTDKLKSLGALAGGVAHEFNNQLMVILGSCELLKKYLNDEKTTYYLENIEYGAKKSSDLINKLLTFGQCDKIPRCDFDLVNCLNNTVDKIKKTDKTSIFYDCVIDELIVNGNYSLIQDAIINICNNSVESFDVDGILTIKASITYLRKLPYDIYNIGEFEEGSYAHIQISDNGSGIKKEHLNKIFDPFYTTKGFEKGLGLSTVLGTIELHKGFIGIKSRVGKGTIFSIYIKLTKGGFEMSEKNVINKNHIMVIDDENLVRIVLKELLNELGYDVECFDSGDKAIEYYKKNQENISLVICDMMMPKLTGKEVFYKLKEVNDKIKFVILSGYSLEDDDNLANEIDAYLRKPITLSSLGEVVEKVLK